ncbi:heme o synthase [Larsenimonas salina]|uniref:heme o synthase n=1 Tax=Larsenimonas salina TaxID=1295565 RepID=UPI002073C7C2|nr:heme o synthase [Larsenimonas salina]MCM5705444.1 heme o synthase [Larsenimonas salina]
MLKNYVQITKPGIIFGNLISVAGGFFLASQGSPDWPLFLATLIGVSLVIASGCVVNNYVDRDIDRRMARTEQRVLVQGLISPAICLPYSIVLGLAGVGVLALYTNAVAVIFAMIGFFVYVFLYTLWLKRGSVHGTLIGSISGACPPVIGYCAVAGQFDAAALCLLIIFSLWQMPHSYAIGIFRYDDYASASIPVLPVKHGIKTAKKHIKIYIVAFWIASLALTLLGYTGIFYFVVALFLGGYWLYLAVCPKARTDDAQWARRLFFFSIIIVMVMSFAMAVDYQPTA